MMRLYNKNHNAPVIDFTKSFSKSSRVNLFDKQAQCHCTNCTWKGQRTVKLKIDLDNKPSYIDVNERLKQIEHPNPCPKCNKGPIRMYLSGPNSYTRARETFIT